MTQEYIARGSLRGMNAYILTSKLTETLSVWMLPYTDIHTSEN